MSNGEEWMLLARLEIPFTAPDGEANIRSQELADELEAKVGMRVGRVTVRRWFYEVATRRPEPKSVATGPNTWMPQGKAKRRRMGAGPVS
jgi:hypothetical protein